MKYLAICVLFCCAILARTAHAESFFPKEGTVTLVDLGANACIPCKMMAPILEKLQKEYKGKADIIFIDVWKNPDAATRHNVKIIPTQIFYNKNGKEVARHEGFLDEKSIREHLDSLSNE